MSHSYRLKTIRLAKLSRGARLVLCLVLSLTVSTCGIPKSQELRVMTFNVRVNLPWDGANAWPQRKDQAASMVRFYEPHLLGVQEALQGQVQDLAQRLPAYSWIGVGRDDGRDQGEFMAIFYQTDRLEFLDQGTFWLSETPALPGKGWDADWIRVVTWGKFKDKLTSQSVYHFNTHLDNRGEVARREGAKLLLERIHNMAGKDPVIVTGDFNSTPDSESYRILTQAQDQGIPALLRDTRSLSQTPHHGPTRTFTAFALDSLAWVAQPIDYILVSEGWQVLKHATLSDSFDGFFPSDHFPVLTELRRDPGL